MTNNVKEKKAPVAKFQRIRLPSTIEGLPQCIYLWIVITCSKGRDQLGKVANPARGQLNRGNKYFPVPVRAWEFGLARRVRQSRPASACSSPYSGWIWVFLTGFLPISAAASIFIYLNRHTPSGRPRIGRVTHLRTDSVHCPRARRHRASIPQGSSKRVLPWQVPTDQLIRARLFPTPTILLLV